MAITVGVLALQGAFREHITLFERASKNLSTRSNTPWSFTEVRNPQELSQCHALVIPGGESTTMALVASRSGLLEPLREFVKVLRKPTWGTCAGLILLAESANRTKRGGQDLIGGLDVAVKRNHFGRQTESFEAYLDLPFLASGPGSENSSFRGIFIRAPVVEKMLPATEGEQVEEQGKWETVVAPSRTPANDAAKAQLNQPVQVLGTLSSRKPNATNHLNQNSENEEAGQAGDVVAVRQGNVFGTSFHPELTGDARIHQWWLEQVLESLRVINGT